MVSNQKISLRPWRNEDADGLSSNANNPKIAKWLSDRFPHPYHIEHAMGWIGYCSGLALPTEFAIEYNSTLVGSIGITIQNDIYRKTGEVGFWLGEAFWNKGIMSYALKEFTAHCFTNLQLNRIYARVFEDNWSSLRVLEKSGFQRLCILRNEILKADEVTNAVLLDQINPVISKQ